MRSAGLAGIEEARVHGRFHGFFKIRVIKHDRRGFAAQFERHALNRCRRKLGDPLAGACRSCERDHVHLWMAGERFPNNGTGAAYQIEHAGRQTNAIDSLGEHECCQRSKFARL